MSTRAHPAADVQNTGSVEDFVSFRWFVTPWIIQVLFWVMVVGIVGFSGFTLFSGLMLLFNESVGLSTGLFVCFTALAYLVVGLMLTRVYCELIILAFRVYDRLGVIATRLDRV